MPSHPTAAILTGDLIGSTQVAPPALDGAMATLRDGSTEIGKWVSKDCKFTRFRGDGWQIQISRPELALRAAIFLVACLRARKTFPATRIAIGIGSVENAGTRDLSDASGQALIQSGRALDNMPKLKILDIAGDGITSLHSGFVNLIDATIRRWTPEQAEAVGYYLHPGNPTLEDIAVRIGISIQAVSYRIRGANGNDLRQALKSWEMDYDLIRQPESS
ncbi:MAG: hypothetical protein ABIV25_09380 [Paracoccaceae bacterium]